ncbi:MAG TPA: hypothetical protein VGI81_06785 [Tepidisphaeraceae bacterium]|jgi:hypothetical protein
MPVHDWTKVDAGNFHAFHHRWISAISDALPEVPLLLEPVACVMAPLEQTYQAAFAALPARWRQVLEPGG